MSRELMIGWRLGVDIKLTRRHAEYDRGRRDDDGGAAR